MKYHHYNLSFMYQSGSTTLIANTMSKTNKQFCNKAAIDSARDYAKLPEGAVLLAVSYLGYMSEEEFNG